MRLLRSIVKALYFALAFLIGFPLSVMGYGGYRGATNWYRDWYGGERRREPSWMNDDSKV